MGEWARLRRGNDWGVEYFYHPDRPKSPAGTYDRNSGVPFFEGEPVRVRWPDGIETTETVRLQARHNSVGDMGRTYEVTFQLPVLEAVVHGVTCWIDLDAVDVWVPSPVRSTEKEK